MTEKVLDMKEFKGKKEWEEFAKSQASLIVKLRVEANQANEKVKHLEQILQNVPTDAIAEIKQLKDKIKHLEQLTSIAPSNFAVASNEEELCKIELARLYQAAKQGPLEWAETRAVEVYAKILLAIRGKSMDEKPKQKQSSYTTAQLLELANTTQGIDDPEQ